MKRIGERTVAVQRLVRFDNSPDRQASCAHLRQLLRLRLLIILPEQSTSRRNLRIPLPTRVDDKVDAAPLLVEFCERRDTVSIDNRLLCSSSDA